MKLFCCQWIKANLLRRNQLSRMRLKRICSSLLIIWTCLVQEYQELLGSATLRTSPALKQSQLGVSHHLNFRMWYFQAYLSKKNRSNWQTPPLIFTTNRRKCCTQRRRVWLVVEGKARIKSLFLPSNDEILFCYYLIKFTFSMSENKSKNSDL